MKIIVNRISLLDTLNLAASVIKTRTPKPVLLCVKLTADKDSVTVASTDLEMSLVSRTTLVQVERTGEILLPADQLRSIFTECSDDSLDIEVTGDNCKVRSSDSTFDLYTQNPADFPMSPEISDLPGFTLPGDVIAKAIRQTAYAVSDISDRYAMTGLLITASKSAVEFVATDGRRLAKARVDLPSNVSETVTAIVPAGALALIAKMSEDDEIRFGFAPSYIMVTGGDHTLKSSIIEGQFPPYEDVIPKEMDKKMTSGTADLITAIRRASLMTTEQSKGIRMRFSNKGLAMASRTPERGQADVNFPCKYEGVEIEIAFNPGFMMEALKAFDAEECTLEMTAPNRPGMLRSGGAKGPLCVLMPVNLQ